MSRFVGLTLSLMISVCCGAFAQVEPRPAAQNGIEIVSLHQPVYPPLARQAAIIGEVRLRLEVRTDGSIDSIAVVSGHPLLAPAALESAKQSRFECRNCQGELTEYFLVYSFERLEASDVPGWPCPEHLGSHVTQVGNHITVATEPSLVYPIFSNTKASSAKCLYLWACGTQWGGESYYYDRVRSPACLGLWNCGHKLREPFATCRELHRKLAY